MWQFDELINERFVFLQSYGYKYMDENLKNSISFVGKNNSIELFFSLMDYEIICQITDAEDKSVTLQDVLEYLKIKEFKGIYQVSKKEEIEKGFYYLAEVLKYIFDKFDISETANFQILYQFRVDRQKKQLEDYYLSIEVDCADNYWRMGEYLKAQDLYEKHINNLSRTQLKKLEYIRKKSLP